MALCKVNFLFFIVLNIVLIFSLMFSYYFFKGLHGIPGQMKGQSDVTLHLQYQLINFQLLKLFFL